VGDGNECEEVEESGDELAARTNEIYEIRETIVAKRPQRITPRVPGEGESDRRAPAWRTAIDDVCGGKSDKPCVEQQRRPTTRAAERRDERRFDSGLVGASGQAAGLPAVALVQTSTIRLRQGSGGQPSPASRAKAGAGGGDRTPTARRPRDFKSVQGRFQD
jgi:hypothetical protein